MNKNSSNLSNDNKRKHTVYFKIDELRQDSRNDKQRTVSLESIFINRTNNNYSFDDLSWKDPNKIKTGAGNIENVYLSTYCLREMLNILQQKTDIADKTANDKEEQNTQQQTENKLWNEIQQLWDTRQKSLNLLLQNGLSAKLIKQLSELITSLEIITKWIENNIYSNTGDMYSVYNWFNNQVKSQNITRTGDFFSLGKEYIPISQFNHNWLTPTSSHSNERSNTFKLGSRTINNIDNNKIQEDKVPYILNSGEFGKILTNYRRILESLKRIYPLVDVIKWTEDLSAQNQNKKIIQSLQQFKDSLEYETEFIQKSVHSVEKVSTSVKESTKVLKHIESLTNSSKPNDIMVECIEKLKSLTNTIINEASISNKIETSTQDYEDNFSEMQTIISDSSNDKLKSAHLQELLDIIIIPSDIAPRQKQQIKQTFLSTLTYFTTPEEILNLLVIRYCIVPMYNNDNIDDDNIFTTNDEILEPFEAVREDIQIPVRLAVIRLLRSWVEYCYVRDFGDNPNLVKRLKQFITGTIAATGNISHAQHILETIQRQEELYKQSLKEQNNSMDSNSPVVLTSSRFGTLLETNSLDIILYVDPLHLAHQLTYYEFNEIYSNIREGELLHQAWNKESTRHKAPYITHSINHFNRFSAWIVRSLLAQNLIENRVNMLKRITVLTLHLLKLRNYNGIIEVLCALNNCAIDRMSLSWSIVGYEMWSIMETLNSLLTNNLRVFRYLWNTSEIGGIPYIGMFLTDLTFLEDGNPSILSDGKVNFNKFSKIYSTIESVLKAQKNPYDIIPDDSMQAFFTQLPKVDHAKSENAWFERSQVIETPDQTKNIQRFSIEIDKSSKVNEAQEILKLLDHSLLKTVFVSSEGMTQQPSSPSRSKIDLDTSEAFSFSILEIDKVVERMKIEVFTSQRRYNLRTYKETFIGSEAITWIEEYFKFPTRSKAIEYGTMLLNQNYFVPLSSNIKKLKDSDVVYRFIEKQSKPTKLKKSKSTLKKLHI